MPTESTAKSSIKSVRECDTCKYHNNDRCMSSYAYSPNKDCTNKDNHKVKED